MPIHHGEKYGLWTAIKDSGIRGKHKEVYWECKCDCGTIRNVRSSNLQRTTKKRSCGCSFQNRSKKLFEKNIEKTDSCWIWKGVIGTRGYGKIGYKDTAHRRAYEYTYGPIPKGKCVCHTCDNRLCVNPAHLFLGSIADNLEDMTNKNRRARGSKIASSKLNEHIVLDMRKMRILGSTYQEIADKYDIGWYLVACICKNRQWKHVPLGKESAEVKRKYTG